MAYIEDGACELVPRNGSVYKSFGRVTNEIARLPIRARSSILKSYASIPKARACSWNLMRKRKADAILYAFDLLWHEGKDLRSQPLLERKARLERLVKGHAGVLFAEHIHAKGVELYRAICDRDLEGILCKHAQAPYVTSPATCFKVLNPNYSQKRGRREMFESFHERRDSLPAT